MLVQYGIPLTIVSYKELYGWTMDEIVAAIGRKNNCTFCGVFRRQVHPRYPVHMLPCSTVRCSTVKSSVALRCAAQRSAVQCLAVVSLTVPMSFLLLFLFIAPLALTPRPITVPVRGVPSRQALDRGASQLFLLLYLFGVPSRQALDRGVSQLFLLSIAVLLWQALDRGASRLKADKVATGHNADDIAETVLLNVVRGDVAR